MDLLKKTRHLWQHTVWADGKLRDALQTIQDPVCMGSITAER